jgi:hypothetical protein
MITFVFSDYWWRTQVIAWQQDLPQISDWSKHAASQ